MQVLSLQCSMFYPKVFYLKLEERCNSQIWHQHQMPRYNRIITSWAVYTPLFEVKAINNRVIKQHYTVQSVFVVMVKMKEEKRRRTENQVKSLAEWNFISRRAPSFFCCFAPAEPAVPPWTSPSSPGAGGRSDPGISAGPRTSSPSPSTRPRGLRSRLRALWCFQLSLVKDVASAAGVAALCCRGKGVHRDTWTKMGKS